MSFLISFGPTVLFILFLQAKRTWFTPLHIAVKRGLRQTVEFLTDRGADVNAVGEEDCMPLTLADKLDPSSEKNFIVDILQKRY